MDQGSQSLWRQKIFSKDKIGQDTIAYKTFEWKQGGSDDPVPFAKPFFFRGENNPV